LQAEGVEVRSSAVAYSARETSRGAPGLVRVRVRVRVRVGVRVRVRVGIRVRVRVGVRVRVRARDGVEVRSGRRGGPDVHALARTALAGSAADDERHLVRARVRVQLRIRVRVRVRVRARAGAGATWCHLPARTIARGLAAIIRPSAAGAKRPRGSANTAPTLKLRRHARTPPRPG